MSYPLHFVTSAPGKAILFGEHSVVHGHTAIASAINLRTYFDVKLFNSTDCDVNNYIFFEFAGALPKEVKVRRHRLVMEANGLSDHALLRLAEIIADESFKENAIQPTVILNIALCMCIVLFLSTSADKCVSNLSQPLLYDSETGVRIKVHSDIPQAAGLGSSGSLSVAGAIACLVLNGTILLSKKWNPTDAELILIEQHANYAETIAHGKPSGLDAAVCTRGGAILFRKSVHNQCSQIAFPLQLSTKVLIVNSGVPRSTVEVVQSVNKRRERSPLRINGIFDSIDTLAGEGKTVISGMLATNLSCFSKKLCCLIEQNHSLLQALDVSHPRLDEIINELSSIYGISAKLTGAGRGGCVIGFLPDDSGVDNNLLDLAAEYFMKQGCWARVASLFASGASLIIKHT